jgi:hypothetical protein
MGGGGGGVVMLLDGMLYCGYPLPVLVGLYGDC